MCVYVGGEGGGGEVCLRVCFGVAGVCVGVVRK